MVFKDFFNCCDALLVRCSRQRVMKCADPGTLPSELKYRCVIFPQYFSVQRSCQLRWQDESHLVLAEQPTDARVFVRDTAVFTKGLAPAPEVSGIALEFIFMRHDMCDLF